MPTADRSRQTWFRMGPDLNMRVSDAERAEVADRLSRHFADGRLDQAEFDERVSRAMAAKTVGDLRGLFDDLPNLPGDVSDDNADDIRAATAAAPGMSRATGCATARRRGPRRGPVRTVVLVALIIAAANITWHAVGFWITPVMWLLVIAAIFVALSSRHHHSGE